MTRQGTMAMNTKPEELSPATAFGAEWLAGRIDQFLTGMLSGRAGCAKLVGVKAATAVNTAPYNSTELLLERIGPVLVLTGGLLLPVLKNTGRIKPHRQLFQLSEFFVIR